MDGAGVGESDADGACTDAAGLGEGPVVDEGPAGRVAAVADDRGVSDEGEGGAGLVVEGGARAEVEAVVCGAVRECVADSDSGGRS